MEFMQIARYPRILIDLGNLSFHKNKVKQVAQTQNFITWNTQALLGHSPDPHTLFDAPADSFLTGMAERSPDFYEGKQCFIMLQSIDHFIADFKVN